MIPTAVLRDRVTIDVHAGVDGEGSDVFDARLENVPARIVDTDRQVRSGTGTDVVTVPVCQLRPNVTVTPQSRVTRGVECWTVDEVRTHRSLGRAWCVELLLDGPRPVVPEPEPEEDGEGEP